MQPIRIYTRTYCAYCDMAKNLLKKRKLSFEEMDITHNHQLRDELSQKHHWKTVPMIFIGEDFIGGFQELEELDRKDLLLKRVQGK